MGCFGGLAKLFRLFRRQDRYPQKLRQHRYCRQNLPERYDDKSRESSELIVQVAVR